MCDPTGPVMITLWVDLVHTWYETMDDPARPFITLTNLRVAELGKKQERHVSLTHPGTALHI